MSQCQHSPLKPVAYRIEFAVPGAAAGAFESVPMDSLDQAETAFWWLHKHSDVTDVTLYERTISGDDTRGYDWCEEMVIRS